MVEITPTVLTLCGATKNLITSADAGTDLVVLGFRVAKVVEVGLVTRVVIVRVHTGR